MSNNKDDALKKQGQEYKDQRAVVLDSFRGEETNDKLDDGYYREQHAERDAVGIFEGYAGYDVQ